MRTGKCQGSKISFRAGVLAFWCQCPDVSLSVQVLESGAGAFTAAVLRGTAWKERGQLAKNVCLVFAPAVPAIRTGPTPAASRPD